MKGLLIPHFEKRQADQLDYKSAMADLIDFASEFGLDMSQIFDPKTLEQVQAIQRRNELFNQHEETGGEGWDEATWKEYEDLMYRVDIGDVGISDVFGQVYEQMRNYLLAADELPDQAKQDGINTSTGLANGIILASPKAIEAADALAQAIRDRIESALDIHSPSRVMEQLGAYTSQGFAQGINSSIADIQHAASGMAAAAISGSAYAPRATATANSGRPYSVEALGTALRAALSGISVNMNGEQVGEMVSETVDREIGRAAYNARYNV